MRRRSKKDMKKFDKDAIVKRHRTYILALLCTAFFMVVTDSTTVFTAIPSIELSLGFAAGDVQWVITAYALTFGCLLLIGGRAADILGRRRMFILGVGLFVLSSLFCGFAWTDKVLIVARTIQGISGAIMTPAALSILMITFKEGTERNKALGVWGALGGIGATSGLLIGGLITEWFGWEWIFFINVPVGLAVFALSFLLLHESRGVQETRRTFDVAGAITITIALFLLVYAISETPTAGLWGMQTIGLLLISGALVLFFIYIESRSQAPLVPLGIFRSRTLVGGNFVCIAAFMAVDGMLFTFTMYAQSVLGYSAVQFALTMMIMTVISIVGVSVGQRFVSRIGVQKVAAFGMVILGIGCMTLTMVPFESSSFIIILIGLLMFGFGMGAAFVASQIAALTGVAEQDSGLASGIVETSGSIGSPLGVSLLAAIAISHTGYIPDDTDQQVQLLALHEGYQFAFGVAAGFALLGLLASLIFLGQPRREKTENTDVSSS